MEATGPIPANPHRSRSSGQSVAVAIPTRNRPAKLEKCLEALSAARRHREFEVVIADSSTQPDLAEQVKAVCGRFPFVRLVRHARQGFGGARNRCAEAAEADLLINVDDDVYVEEEAIARLTEAYERGRGWRVVAGTVSWGTYWSRPVVVRNIGYGRAARDGETPDFLVGAFFVYPRALAESCPWLETIPTSDDRMMGALWRAKGVSLEFAPTARAYHDQEASVYREDAYADHIYANLFDALLIRPSIPRALSYELLGFAACLNECLSKSRSPGRLFRAWVRGHVNLITDWRRLRSVAAAPLPAAPD
jgi:glycosyltransferase involved in cell wall biosynthesis